eukprot:CAMPEP_0115867148 /NCGR_PEP_ID=MMETSP0287-20121206/20617_1 /TAXON_ID=412157 /ORGANISM="Chrysochromulina rotalis, Strain UIO044" /LENGTH=46 /DNA_ID= /DNA_START= /DNA_END= /DNA_ORIENTATION=
MTGGVTIEASRRRHDDKIWDTCLLEHRDSCSVAIAPGVTSRGVAPT